MNSPATPAAYPAKPQPLACWYCTIGRCPHFDNEIPGSGLPSPRRRTCTLSKAGTVYAVTAYQGTPMCRDCAREYSIAPFK